MHVEDVMTPSPQCASPETNIRDVAKMMVDCDCGEIPVVDDDEKPVGVITDRDIACRVVAQGKDPMRTRVGDAMSSPVVTVTPEMDLEECCRLMEEKQIRRIPVVDDNGACCGIVSQADIALRADTAEAGTLVRDVSRPSGDTMGAPH
ncbi:MAG: CBS domain-containing protein [Sulfurifustis sp.]